MQFHFFHYNCTSATGSISYCTYMIKWFFLAGTRLHVFRVTMVGLTPSPIAGGNKIHLDRLLPFQFPFPWSSARGSEHKKKLYSDRNLSVNVPVIFQSITFQIEFFIGAVSFQIPRTPIFHADFDFSRSDENGKKGATRVFQSGMKGRYFLIEIILH